MRVHAAALRWEDALERLVPGLPLVRVLASILEAAPEVLFAKDLEGRYLMMNRAGADALGLSVEAILGRTDEELFAAAVAAGIRAWDRKVIDSGLPLRYEGAAPLGPRAIVYMTSKAPLLDPDGRTVGLVGMSRDISDVRRLEQDLARLNQQSVDLLCVFGPDGCIRFVSDSFERVLGWPRREVLGKRQRDMVHPEDWPASREVLRALIEDQQPVIDFRNRVRCSDGGYRWLEWRCDPPVGDGVVYAIAREVTARTRQEQELVAAKDEAEALASRRARFLADMSHEIRTPLNAIIAGVEVALASPMDASVREILSVVSTASESLFALVNDVLDLSKIEADALDLDWQPCSPAAVLRQAASLVHDRALRRGVELVVQAGPELPALVLGDGNRLRQILVNLLDNAIKFGDASTVTASVGAAGEVIRYVVADQGPGIAPERLPTLFSPYRQGDPSQSARHGGTGLGLAISRRLAEQMGGTLEVDGGSPRGASFTLALPLRAIAVADAAPAAAVIRRAPSALGELHVLVAEDEPLNQLIVSRLLESLGCRPRVVGDGAAAVAAVLERRPDLVVLDVQMPVMGGIEAARRIRELHPSAPPLLVALTASVTREVREACAAAGVDDYVTKPVRREALVAVLEKAAAIRPSAGDVTAT